MMKNSLFSCLAGLEILCGAAQAQIARTAASAFGVQNFDVSVLSTVAVLPSQTVANSNVTIFSSSQVDCCSGEVGYQLARTSAGSFWLEYAHTECCGGERASIPHNGSSGMRAETLGLRFMVPLHSRLSAFGAAGGGAGTFHYPWVLEGPTPYLLFGSTLHGVTDFGGGIDVRLSRRISIRAELRDYVSGRGLSGEVGTNRALPLFGVGFHF